jgi:hypothetical protein
MKKLLITIPFLFLAAACNKQTAQVQPVQNQQPPQAQQQTKPADETANWKIYSNGNDGYEFKYPTDWKLVEYKQDRMAEVGPVADIGHLTIFSVGIDSRPLSEIEKGFAKANVKFTELNVGGEAAKSYYYSDANQPHDIYFSHNGFTYHIIQDEATTIKIEVNQILSTFKFINQTSDWKIYTSEYGYTVKYPDGWEITEESSSNPVYNQKYGQSIAFGIFGPWRNDLPGAAGKAQFSAGVSYHKDQQKFLLDENTMGFIYPGKPGDQAVNNVDLSADFIKTSPEYSVAQAIVNTAKR